jgi:hypothetical protein
MKKIKQLITFWDDLTETQHKRIMCVILPLLVAIFCASLPNADLLFRLALWPVLSLGLIHYALTCEHPEKPKRSPE